MATINEGVFHVFTYKDGLLSKVAHDLRLRLTRFEVVVDGDAVSGTFWPAALEVEGPMVRGQLDAGGLSDKDRRDIRGSINDKILLTARHPQATFEGTRMGARVSGQLTLVGRSAPVDVHLTEDGDRLRGEVTLTPTRWGIKPFKALLGAIKLKDQVLVRFDLPRPA